MRGEAKAASRRGWGRKESLAMVKAGRGVRAVGAAGFVFFLAKGLVWLVIFAGGAAAVIR